MRLSLRDVEDYTLRELYIQYQNNLIHSWDPHAMTTSQIYNLTVMVGSLFSKKKPRFIKWTDAHPYRESSQDKEIIHDIKVLKMYGDQMTRSRA